MAPTFILALLVAPILRLGLISGFILILGHEA